MAVEADPARPSEPDLAALGRLFSESVRSVPSRYGAEDLTAWQIADVLIAYHDYGGKELLPLADRNGEFPEADHGGERATMERWMLRVGGLFDQEAVARTSSKVIDTRLTLLALARIEPGIDELFRRA